MYIYSVLQYIYTQHTTVYIQYNTGYIQYISVLGSTTVTCFSRYAVNLDSSLQDSGDLFMIYFANWVEKFMLLIQETSSSTSTPIIPTLDLSLTDILT